MVARQVGVFVTAKRSNAAATGHFPVLRVMMKRAIEVAGFLCFVCLNVTF